MAIAKYAASYGTTPIYSGGVGAAVAGVVAGAAIAYAGYTKMEKDIKMAGELNSHSEGLQA